MYFLSFLDLLEDEADKLLQKYEEAWCMNIINQEGQENSRVHKQVEKSLGDQEFSP